MSKPVWVSRDPANSGGDENAVMISVQKPYQEDTIACQHCGKDTGTSAYHIDGGLSFGEDNNLCYSGWLKLTGFKLEKGDRKQVLISVKEVSTPRGGASK